MFSDDEDELELLRQYGDRDLHADDSEGHSSDEMDSDLEDKIMSMVQYGSGLKKKVAPAPAAPEKKSPEVVLAPKDDNTTSSTSKFSAADELNIGKDNDDEDEDENGNDDDDSSISYSGYQSAEEDLGVPETPAPPQESQPQVTNYINLDDKHYMDDEEMSEEEEELGIKLQELIDDQIYNRQAKTRYTNKPIRVCFGCSQPGHERKDCNICGECGGPRHADSRCVGARYCSRCKMRGHNAADCENHRETGNCKICHISYHNTLNCPSLLHRYENEKPSKKVPVAYCYYCTSKGHYGDECPDLPNYLTSMPSAFSKYSLSEGSRFDPKKTMKNSASSFSQPSHQRWSDSSRESSPHRGYNNDRHSHKKRRYDSDNDSAGSYKKHNKNNNYNNSSSNSNSRYDDRDYNSNHNNRKRSNNPNSYKDNNSGGKRRRTDVDDSRPHSHLDEFFTSSSNDNSNRKKQKDNRNYNNNSGKSGNNNWKAMNNNGLPQPTRSGTVNINKNDGRGDRGRYNQQDYSGDFPRGNGSDLPKPSSSGVIDLTKDNNNTGYSKRGPKYHGGYNRR